jgi:transcription antitermination factor NusG
MFIPWATRRVFVRNMAVEMAQPLFGAYGFAGFDIEADNWRPINRAKGVVRLLPKGRETPLPLPDGVVERWQARYEAGEFKAQDILGLLIGDLVVVSSGLYRNHVGTFAGISASGALGIILQMLGREVVAKVRPSEIQMQR